MPVGMIFDSGQAYSGRAYRDCISSAHAQSVPIILARRGMRWMSGDGVTLDGRRRHYCDALRHE